MSDKTVKFMTIEELMNLDPNTKITASEDRPGYYYYEHQRPITPIADPDDPESMADAFKVYANGGGIGIDYSKVRPSDDLLPHQRAFMQMYGRTRRSAKIDDNHEDSPFVNWQTEWTKMIDRILVGSSKSRLACMATERPDEDFYLFANSIISTMGLALRRGNCVFIPLEMSDEEILERRRKSFENHFPDFDYPCGEIKLESQPYTPPGMTDESEDESPILQVYKKYREFSGHISNAKFYPGVDPWKNTDESHLVKLPNNDEGDDGKPKVVHHLDGTSSITVRITAKKPVDKDVATRNLTQYADGIHPITTKKYSPYSKEDIERLYKEIVTDEDFSKRNAEKDIPAISEEHDDAIRYPMPGDVWKSFSRAESVYVLKTTPRLVWVGFSLGDIQQGEVMVMSRDQYNAFMRVGGHKEDNYKTLSPFRPTANKHDINNAAKFALLGRSSTEDDLFLMEQTLKCMIDTNRRYTEYTPV